MSSATTGNEPVLTLSGLICFFAVACFGKCAILLAFQERLARGIDSAIYPEGRDCL
jgi:hypothetical protein